jgi:hypothetical protein
VCETTSYVPVLLVIYYTNCLATKQINMEVENTP